jgi:tetratricopeptide (TPR) repeat protein
VSRATIDRWTGFSAILLCVPLVLIFRWVNFALSDDLYGGAFSLFGYTPIHPHFTFASFGVIAAAILMLAAMFCALRRPLWQCLMAGALFLLLAYAYLQVAVGDPRLAIEAARQSDWFLWIVAGQSPGNHPETELWQKLAFDTVGDRLYTGWFYLGLGWYLGLLAAIAMFVAAARSIDTRYARRIATLTLLSTAALAVLLLVRPFRAERAFEVAAQAQADARYEYAITSYGDAMRMDSWYGLNPRIHERIGAAYTILQRVNEPDAVVYRSELTIDRYREDAATGDLPRAIADYDLLSTRDDAIGIIARWRAADVGVIYGLHLFQGGAFGPAVRAWEQVLQKDPDNWQAAYYLTMGYPQVGRYREMAAVSQRFIDHCADPVALGAFYLALGDAQTWMGTFGTGHEAYYKSYYYDYSFNPRGLSSLSNP